MWKFITILVYLFRYKSPRVKCTPLLCPIPKKSHGWNEDDQKNKKEDDKDNQNGKYVSSVECSCGSVLDPDCRSVG